jgi:putative acetyltransferase
MHIRKYTDKDYTAVVEIYNLSKIDELQYEEVQFKLLPLAEDSKRLFELKESDIYVYSDLTVIGYCAIYGTEIRALFVHPNWRGEGVGRSLLEYLLSKCTGEVSLFVAESNLPAKKLYALYDFKIVDEFKTTYNGEFVLANKMIHA